MIAYAGKLLVHAVRALLVCWQRMLRLGLSVGVLSGLIALVFGAYVTRAFPPAPLTWVAAMFFGFALGYAAAMTVLADEMLLSVVEAVRVLEGDVKAGLRAAAVAAEREAGEAGRGIMRFLGHPRSTPDSPRTPSTPGTSATAPSRAPSSQPLVTLSSVERHDPGHDQANETLAAIAATESFINTTPRPAVNARPVRADQLPRIGWANQDDATGARVGALPAAPEVAVAAPAPALAEMPPLPIRTLRSQPREETLPPGTAGAAGSVPGPAGRGESEGQDDAATQPAADVEVASEPAGMPAIQQGDATQPTGADEAVGVAAEAGDSAAGTSAPEAAPAGSDAATDADHPVITAAQPAETNKEERGIWARIGKALIGNTTVPLREANAAGNASSQSETSQP